METMLKRSIAITLALLTGCAAPVAAIAPSSPQAAPSSPDATAQAYAGSHVGTASMSLAAFRAAEINLAEVGR